MQSVSHNSPPLSSGTSSISGCAANEVPVWELADLKRLAEPADQAVLRGEADVLLAGSIGRPGSGCGAASAGNQGPLAASRNGADQRSSARAATDQPKIALLMRPALGKDTRGLHRDRFSVDHQRGQRQPDVAGTLQPSGMV